MESKQEGFRSAKDTATIGTVKFSLYSQCSFALTVDFNLDLEVILLVDGLEIDLSWLFRFLVNHDICVHFLR